MVEEGNHKGPPTHSVQFVWNHGCNQVNLFFIFQISFSNVLLPSAFIKKKTFGNFLPLGDNKRGAATDIKDFFGRNDPKLPYFKKKKLKLPKYIGVAIFFYFPL